MADSLEEAKEKYRSADRELLAARKAFDEAPWTDRDRRIETWERLLAAEAAYRDAMTAYTPWITEKSGRDYSVEDEPVTFGRL